MWGQKSTTQRKWMILLTQTVSRVHTIRTSFHSSVFTLTSEGFYHHSWLLKSYGIIVSFLQVRFWDLRTWCSASLSLCTRCWRTTSSRARWRKPCPNSSTTSSCTCRSLRIRWGCLYSSMSKHSVCVYVYGDSPVSGLIVCSLVPSDQSVDSEPTTVCRGWGWRHLLLLCQDLCSGPAAGERKHTTLIAKLTTNHL